MEERSRTSWNVTSQKRSVAGGLCFIMASLAAAGTWYLWQTPERQFRYRTPQFDHLTVTGEPADLSTAFRSPVVDVFGTKITSPEVFARGTESSRAWLIRRSSVGPYSLAIAADTSGSKSVVTFPIDSVVGSFRDRSPATLHDRLPALLQQISVSSSDTFSLRQSSSPPRSWGAVHLTSDDVLLMGLHRFKVDSARVGRYYQWATVQATRRGTVNISLSDPEAPDSASNQLRATRLQPRIFIFEASRSPLPRIPNKQSQTVVFESRSATLSFPSGTPTEGRFHAVFASYSEGLTFASGKNLSTLTIDSDESGSLMIGAESVRELPPSHEFRIIRPSDANMIFQADSGLAVSGQSKIVAVNGANLVARRWSEVPRWALYLAGSALLGAIGYTAKVALAI